MDASRPSANCASRCSLTVPEYYDYQENEDFYNYEYTEYKDTEEDYDMIFDKVTVYSHVNAPGGR